MSTAMGKSHGTRSSRSPRTLTVKPYLDWTKRGVTILCNLKGIPLVTLQPENKVSNSNPSDLVLGHDGEGGGDGDNHSRLTGTLDLLTKQSTGRLLFFNFSLPLFSLFYFIFYFLPRRRPLRPQA